VFAVIGPASLRLLGGIMRMLQKLTKAIRETWFFWLFFLVLGFMTSRQTETSQIPPRADLLISLAFALLVSFWVVLDARQRERQMGYGFPALVFFIWPIFAPIYLFQTRGARAFLSLLGFAALFCVAAGVGAFIGAFTQSSP
jgi:hypothetical protein